MSSNISRNDVLDKLMEVIDPEFYYNIVDLGLVYDVIISDEKVTVEFTLTHEGCPFGPEIEQNIVACLSSITDKMIIPKLVWEPPWEAYMMADEIKLDMGIPIF